MRLTYYLLLFAFHFAVFTQWARGNEPKFTVENKTTPAYTVINKTVPATVNYSGDWPPFAAPAGKGWRRYSGQPWELYDEVQSGASGVAPRKTFLAGDYHAGHRCPSCGNQSPAGGGTWVVRGHNADGTHFHRCDNCGASWRH